MNDVDKRIIKLINGESRMSVNELITKASREIGISPEEAAWRVSRMALTGVIRISSEATGAAAFFTPDAAWMWLILSTQLLSIALTAMNYHNPIIIALRIIIGAPAFLYFPGYAIFKAIYPTRNPLNAVESFLVSIGVSMAMDSLIPFLLSLTPLGFNAIGSSAILTIITTISLILSHRAKTMMTPTLSD